MRCLSRGFYTFQLASFGNMFSLRMFQLTLAWWTLDETGSTDLFSYVVGFGIFLEVLINLSFGWLGDYKSRKSIYLASLVLSGMSVVGFIVLYYITEFEFISVLLVSAIMGIANGIRMPIEGSVIPELVTKDDISEAIAQKSTIYAIGNIAGPVTAGVLLELFTIGVVLITCVVLVAMSIILTKVSSNYFFEVKTKHVSIEPFYIKSFSGLKILFHTKTEFYMALLSVLINFTIYPLFFLLLPAFVKLYLDSEAWNIALIEFGFSIGVFLGSTLVVSYSNKIFGRYASLLMGVIFLGIGMLGYVVFDKPIILMFTMFLGGVGLMLYNINSSVVRTIATPQSHLSRMFSSVIFLSSIANPLGVIVCGVLISSIGIINTFFVFSVMIFICVPFVYLIPKYRSIMAMNDNELNDVYESIYPKAFIRS